MSTEFYGRDVSAWRKAKNFHVCKSDGKFVEPVTAYAHDGTAWRLVYTNEYNIGYLSFVDTINYVSIISTGLLIVGFQTAGRVYTYNTSTGATTLFDSQSSAFTVLGQTLILSTGNMYHIPTGVTTSTSGISGNKLYGSMSNQDCYCVGLVYSGGTLSSLSHAGGSVSVPATIGGSGALIWSTADFVGTGDGNVFLSVFDSTSRYVVKCVLSSGTWSMLLTITSVTSQLSASTGRIWFVSGGTLYYSTTSGISTYATGVSTSGFALVAEDTVIPQMSYRTAAPPSTPIYVLDTPNSSVTAPATVPAAIRGEISTRRGMGISSPTVSSATVLDAYYDGTYSTYSASSIGPSSPQRANRQWTGLVFNVTSSSQNENYTFEYDRISASLKSGRNLQPTLGVISMNDMIRTPAGIVKMTYESGASRMRVALISNT